MGHGALDAVKTPILGQSVKPDGATPFLHKFRVMEKIIGTTSSVIYGMPKAAAELDAADMILALNQIPKTLMGLFQRRLKT